MTRLVSIRCLDSRRNASMTTTMMYYSDKSVSQRSSPLSAFCPGWRVGRSLKVAIEIPPKS